MQYTGRFDGEVLVICISLTDNFYAYILHFHASPWIAEYYSIVNLLFYRYPPHEATQPPSRRDENNVDLPRGEQNMRRQQIGMREYDGRKSKLNNMTSKPELTTRPDFRLLL